MPEPGQFGELDLIEQSAWFHGYDSATMLVRTAADMLRKVDPAIAKVIDGVADTLVKTRDETATIASSRSGTRQEDT